MTNRRKGAMPCPVCGAHAHMGSVTVASSGRELYAVVCDRAECRLSAMPPVGMCRETERAAVAAWNGGTA